MLRPWYNLMMLGAESQQVIWLRLMKLAAGGTAAQNEARLMLSEKVSAAHQAGEHILRGGSADSVVRGYRKKVRANVRRLSK
jgi:hypothetical protein